MGESHIIGILFLLIIIFFMVINQIPHLKEFKVNKYLKLKLEGGRTNIYVNNRRFRQCMYLLLNIPLERIEEYDEIESIDEAAIKLNRSMERDHRKVPPETEFWGHCSNLQAWVENGYDTRILHRNLAFPLLKKLSEVGDPIARNVFSEEIAMRLASKHPTVTQYLTQNGYLKYLTPDEFESILDEINPTVLNEITIELNNILEQNPNIDLSVSTTHLINRLFSNFGIDHISLLTYKILNKIPERFRDDLVKNIYNLLKKRKNFPMIQYLNKHLEYFKDYEFEFNIITYNDRIIGIFRDEWVYLNDQNIQDIVNLNINNDKLENIKELDLSNNQISNLEGIEKFPQIRILRLNNNKLKNINGIGSLKNLEKLFLRNNQVSEINNLKILTNLKHLDLSNNPTMTEIPKVLNELSNLEYLKLWNCPINHFSKSTEKFFWMNQNYRYFTGYRENDKEFYESLYRKKASSDNKLYKHFVKWVLKMRNLMKKHGFSYQDINRFYEETSKNAVWSGRVTNSFKRWLDEKKYQKKISSFL